MKTKLAIVFIFLASTLLLAQTSKAKSVPPAKKAPTAATKAQTASLPTKEQVDSFLHRMFGQDPNATWRILDIAPSADPALAEVVLVIGNQTRATRLLVTPDGKHAIAGELIPFGVDPFSGARQILKDKAKGRSKGPASAAVTLVEFSDLQCPHCKAAQPVIDRLVAEMPETRLIFQPFPLPMHKWAAPAASFAECVAQQKPEAFWTFLQSVYDAQASIKDAEATVRLTELATASGVDGAKTATCSDSPQVYVKVQQSIELGKTLEVNSTPTLFINGRMVQNFADMPFESLKALVAFEAAEAAKKSN